MMYHNANVPKARIHCLFPDPVHPSVAHPNLLVTRLCAIATSPHITDGSRAFTNSDVASPLMETIPLRSPPHVTRRQASIDIVLIFPSRIPRKDSLLHDQLVIIALSHNTSTIHHVNLITIRQRCDAVRNHNDRLPSKQRSEEHT